MRFLKVLTFVFLLIFSTASFAGLISASNKQTLKEAGYTDAQIDQFNQKLDQYVSNDITMLQLIDGEGKEMFRRLLEDSDFEDRLSLAQKVGEAQSSMKEYAKIGLDFGKGVWDNLTSWDALIDSWKKMLGYSDKGTFVKIHNGLTSLNNGCLFCTIYEKLLTAINTLATQISSGLRDAFIKLLWIFLLFYIAFKVLKAVISFGEINPKEFLADLFIPLLKTTLAIIVLYNISFFYSQVVSPLIELSLGFATKIQETDTMQVYNITRNGGNLVTMNACQITASVTASENQALGPGVNQAIQCYLTVISLSLINYIAMAASFVADCWFKDNFFEMFTMGLCLLVPTFMIFLSFPFKLLDSIFRLMFVCALMPLWVILWVLPATREYIKSAFNMFLHVLISFVCLSVIMMMALKILGGFLNGMPQAQQTQFWEYLFQDKTSDAAKLIDWGTGAFFICLAMSFLALSLVNKTESFVGQFISAGGSLGMGGGLEKLGVKGAQLVGSKAVKPLAKKAAEGTGKFAGRAMQETWEGTKNLSKAAAKKSLYGTGYALGAAKRGLRDLNSGPKISSGQAMMPTGVLPTNPTASSGGNISPLKANPSQSQSETLPDGSTKETKKTSYTDQEGRKKMEYTHEAVKKNGKEVSTSVKREKFDERGNSTGSTTVETDKVSGKKTLTEKDAKGKEVRIIIKTPDGTTTTQNNYVYDVDGKLSAFEKKIEEKIAGKMTVTKHVKVDAKTGTETDILPHP